MSISNQKLITVTFYDYNKFFGLSYSLTLKWPKKMRRGDWFIGKDLRLRIFFHRAKNEIFHKMRD